jgi:bacillolysin
MREWVNGLASAAVIAVAIAIVASRPVAGQAPAPERTVAAESPLSPGVSAGSALAALRAAAQEVDARVASGDLRSRSREADPLVSGRMHERLAQYYRGVPVFGADTTRQVNTFGQTISVIGVYYPDIAIDATTTVTSDEARALLALSGGAGTIVRADPVLTVLPFQGSYRLTWTAAVGSVQDGLVHRTFIDAVTGEAVFSYDDTWTQAAQSDVGRGIGLAGDTLTVNDQRIAAGTFQAVD